MFGLFRIFKKKPRDFDKLIAPILPQLKAAGVKKLGFFGSFARGEERPDSDIDVLVEFAPDALSLHHLCDVGEVIEKYFRRRADIVLPDALRAHWKNAILPTVKYAKID